MNFTLFRVQRLSLPRSVGQARMALSLSSPANKAIRPAAPEGRKNTAQDNVPGFADLQGHPIRRVPGNRPRCNRRPLADEEY